ncbi:hypothetical protein CDAR_612631 [Caerostris darwini]|uniref:Uncharacterized protein n=1 Tax=Caerostris darwini TaxID=1538125 RepID=A0AAV4SH25_9ARAC|nr:hypothetical protein CDAR_612631 [Caerostris darwini]
MFFSLDKKLQRGSGDPRQKTMAAPTKSSKQADDSCPHVKNPQVRNYEKAHFQKHFGGKGKNKSITEQTLTDGGTRQRSEDNHVFPLLNMTGYAGHVPLCMGGGGRGWTRHKKTSTPPTNYEP